MPDQSVQSGSMFIAYLFLELQRQLKDCFAPWLAGACSGSLWKFAAAEPEEIISKWSQQGSLTKFRRVCLVLVVENCGCGKILCMGEKNVALFKFTNSKFKQLTNTTIICKVITRHNWPWERNTATSLKSPFFFVALPMGQTIWFADFLTVICWTLFELSSRFRSSDASSKLEQRKVPLIIGLACCSVLKGTEWWETLTFWET